jgi:hypothetical protein
MKFLIVNDDFMTVMILETIFKNKIGVPNDNLDSAINGLEAY